MKRARRLFWVAAGTLDALGKNAFPISNPLKQALAKVEREIKRLADGGDAVELKTASPASRASPLPRGLWWLFWNPFGQFSV